MKTTLPESITTIEEAKEFLLDLLHNREAYHPDDPAKDCFDESQCSNEEAEKLDLLMEQCMGLSWSAPHDDLYGFLLNMDPTNWQDRENGEGVIESLGYLYQAMDSYRNAKTESVKEAFKMLIELGVTVTEMAIEDWSANEDNQTSYLQK